MNDFTGMLSFGGWRGAHHVDSGARSAASDAKSRSLETETRLNRALLAMEALWTLLRERTDLTDEDLADRMVALDAADGRVDGRARRDPAVCDGCRRPSSRRFDSCLYCGHAIPLDPFA